MIPDEPNYEKAYLWFLVSAALMQEGSASGRDDVEKQLESEKVVKIKRELLTFSKAYRKELGIT